MNTKHGISGARIIIILFVLLSFNVVAGLAVSAAKNSLDYAPEVILMIAIFTIILADFVFIYILVIKFPALSEGAREHLRFEGIFNKHFNGKNYDEAFDKSFKEWKLSRRRN